MMFFGAEFFNYNLSFAGGGWGFFGESDLAIPDNLFDLGIRAIFGLGFEIEPENCNYFSEKILNYHFRADIILNSLRENLFGKNYFDKYNYNFKNYQRSSFDSKNFNRFFYGIFDSFGIYTDGKSNSYYLSNGFSRDIEKTFSFYHSNYFKELESSVFSRSYSVGLIEKSNLIRKIYEEFYGLFKNSDFIFREFEELNKFSSINSEKSSGIIDFFQSRFIDAYRESFALNSDFRAEKINVIFRKNNTEKIPENIYSAAARSNYFEEAKLGSGDYESASSRLNKRVDRLEEIIRSNKTTFGIDYDSVARQLELELRSALNSCCEGVHF